MVPAIVQMATFEFTSFTAMAERERPRYSAGAAAVQPPWVPNGPSKQHQRSKGIPSRQELEAVGHERARHVAENDVLHSRLEGCAIAMDHLDDKIDGVVNEFEAHIISATANQVLIANRLAALGVALQ